MTLNTTLPIASNKQIYDITVFRNSDGDFAAHSAHWRNHMSVTRQLGLYGDDILDFLSTIQDDEGTDADLKAQLHDELGVTVVERPTDYNPYTVVVSPNNVAGTALVLTGETQGEVVTEAESHVPERYLNDGEEDTAFVHWPTSTDPRVLAETVARVLHTTTRNVWVFA